MSAQPKPRIRVVAAVLRNAQGNVLVTQRPDGKPLAGFWEFPGGKVAAGESDAMALQRELREELGIEVQQCSEFMQLAHEYPERCVELVVFMVDRWLGEATGLEGQPLKWLATAQLPEVELLPADRPIVEFLARG